MARPHAHIHGCNFAGVTTARYNRASVMDEATVTITDRKSLLNFVPNIPLQVLANIKPAIDLNYKFMSFLEHGGSDFIQAKLIAINQETTFVYYYLNERIGHPVRKIKYDYLVMFYKACP
jgi:sulfide:quinone oxidoreductase